ncbi:flavin-containing monooxygenase [Jatrophihabitans fulvus]
MTSARPTSSRPSPGPAGSPEFDVLVVGAGISGISMACHLERERPGTSYAVIERRQNIGGTWDLFRYPGIRSDSDMSTFAFGFRPWRSPRILADGTSIRDYLAETAEEYGVRERIRFGLKVTSADFDTHAGFWTVTVEDEAAGTTSEITARFVVAGTGYYDYDRGYRPDFPGEERFQGTLVHPQHWPEDLDHTGKRVVIIGSGATAVTLVPAMADAAEHVTMLQRSPTYILSLPVVDQVTAGLSKVLPDAFVYRTTRLRNIAMQRAIYGLARHAPGVVKDIVRRGVKGQLRDTGDLADFTPSYEPWDQRMCFVPDGDLFAAIRSGTAEVVTDRIETFTETGIRLESGRELEADIVVTATGLQVQLLGGADLSVDGEAVALNERLTYKGVMIEGVPNAAMIFGYINASWTLKADLSSHWVCRLLEHMERHGYDQVVVHADDDQRTDSSMMSALNAGYVKRGNGVLPRQGRSGPWRVTNDFVRDALALRRGAVDDGTLEFATTSVDERPARRSRASA